MFDQELEELSLVVLLLVTDLKDSCPEEQLRWLLEELDAGDVVSERLQGDLLFVLCDVPLLESEPHVDAVGALAEELFSRVQ